MWSEEHFDSGLVKVDAYKVHAQVTQLIEERKEFWAKEDQKFIDQYIAWCAQRHWFRMPEIITEEEAIKRLDKDWDDSLFEWRCQRGSFWLKKWEVIQQMCEMAMKLETHEIYLSGDQIESLYK